MSTDTLSELLQQAHDLAQKHEHNLRESGELFNLYEMLGVERKENQTHSAMIGSLLNPRGVHLHRNLFLRLFLEMVGYQGQFDADSAWLTLEKHIGRVDHDADSGGRIDIYLNDKHGNSISIENKIWAGDQYTQIARYCNHNQERNTVYYLSLSGDAPSKDSHQDKIAGKDFHLISYQTHILQWLEECLQALQPTSLTYANIWQYQLLVKKLTEMRSSELNEIERLILNNFEGATQIEQALPGLRAKVGEELRKGVMERLKESLGDEFVVKQGENITGTYAQIWVSFKDSRFGNNLHFGIESFSGNSNLVHGNMFIGIINPDQQSPFYTFVQPDHEKIWYSRHFFQWGDAFVNLANADVMKQLAQPGMKDALIDLIVNGSLAYIKEKAPQVKDFLLEHHPTQTA